MSGRLTLQDLRDRLAGLSAWAERGCGDGCCRVQKPVGMHTNGGCRCTPAAFADSLLALAIELEAHGKYRWWSSPAESTSEGREASTTQEDQHV